MEPISPPPPKKTIWPALLGLFIVWQLVYLVGHNALQFIPVRVPITPGDEVLELQQYGTFTHNLPLQSSVDLTQNLFTRYSELSGQVQFWKLFTPEFPPQAIGLQVYAYHADGREELLRDNLPEGPAPMARLPRAAIRQFHFEYMLVTGPWMMTPEYLAEKPDECWGILHEYALGKQQAYKTYLRFLWHQKHTEALPPRMELRLKTIPVHGQTAGTHSYLRWTPATDELEIYNPITRHYQPIALGGQ